MTRDHESIQSNTTGFVSYISIIQRGKASKLLTIWLTPKNIQVQSKHQGAQVRQVPFPKDKKI